MAKKYKYTTAQLLDENLKNEGGESRKEVTERMTKALNRILNKYCGKRVAIVSHGAAINYLLMKWCTFNENQKIEYNGEEQ